MTVLETSLQYIYVTFKKASGHKPVVRSQWSEAHKSTLRCQQKNQNKRLHHDSCYVAAVVGKKARLERKRHRAVKNLSL